MVARSPLRHKRFVVTQIFDSIMYELYKSHCFYLGVSDKLHFSQYL